MKQLRLALVVFASTLGLLRAQDDEHRAPPTEIPDFSNLDEYIYIPKSTVTLGFRHLSGAKTQFYGHGSILAPEVSGDATTANIARAYHDGAVQPDSRSAPRLDSSGNPVLDPSGGAQIFDPIAPDGKTNSWSYTDSKQVTSDGFIAFHTYSADVTDTAVRKQAALATNGLDLAVTRDMGKLFGTRLQWAFTSGMSVNDISATSAGLVQANINTVTDFYSLFGQTAPAAPYSAPSSTSQPVLDAGGNALTGDDGSAQTTIVDTTVLIGNLPSRPDKTTLSNATSVSNRWKLKGAYFTFRAGPTFVIPISTRFHASISVGPALIFAGSKYTVTETFTPALGTDISATETKSMNRLLPGYYADATLQFDLTERTGFYAGALFQSAGSYTQKIDSATANYASKIDLSNQNGLRAGMAIRF